MPIRISCRLLSVLVFLLVRGVGGSRVEFTMAKNAYRHYHVRDYLKGGAFVNAGTIPSPQSIETFYKTQMISRTINAKWKTSRVFIMFTQGLNEGDASGPNQTKYYSKEDAGVYYLYQYVTP